MNFTVKLRIVLVGVIFCVSGAVSAFDAQMLEEQCEKIPSNYNEYKTEACPDITVIASCINHTGFFGISSDEEFKKFADFTVEAFRSCRSACEENDFGACHILGGATSNGSLGYLIPKENYDKVGLELAGYEAFSLACEGGVADACREAATIADQYWAPLRNHSSSIKTSCYYDEDSPLCKKIRVIEAQVDENNWFTVSPMEFYIKGCDLDDAKSCKQAFEFSTRYPDLVDDEIDPEQYRKRACDIGIKLFKCDG